MAAHAKYVEQDELWLRYMTHVAPLRVERVYPAGAPEDGVLRRARLLGRRALAKLLNASMFLCAWCGQCVQQHGTGEGWDGIDLAYYKCQCGYEERRIFAPELR